LPYSCKPTRDSDDWQENLEYSGDMFMPIILPILPSIPASSSDFRNDIH